MPKMFLEPLKNPIKRLRIWWLLLPYNFRFLLIMVPLIALGLLVFFFNENISPDARALVILLSFLFASLLIYVLAKRAVSRAISRAISTLLEIRSDPMFRFFDNITFNQPVVWGLFIGVIVVAITWGLFFWVRSSREIVLDYTLILAILTSFGSIALAIQVLIARKNSIINQRRQESEFLTKGIEYLHNKNDIYLGCTHINTSTLSDDKESYEQASNALCGYIRKSSPSKGEKVKPTDNVQTVIDNVFKKRGLTPNLYKATTRGLVFIDLSNTNLNGADFREANLIGANLQHTNLQKANLNRARLRNADLNGANLQNAQLEYANLQNVRLRFANLQNAQLEYANLLNADLQNADLQHADLSNAKLQNANLYKANLQNAQLEYANLRNVDLHGTNLQEASIGRANLENTNLQGANLQNVQLLDVELRGAEFENTKFSKLSPEGAPMEKYLFKRTDLSKEGVDELIKNGGIVLVDEDDEPNPKTEPA